MRVAVAAALALSVSFAARAPAVTLGQVDTFAVGTTQGWSAGAGGAPTPPQVVFGGGPGGAGDNYLQITAVGGTGPGSRLVAFNGTQWAGNYLTAGVTGIEMDLRNLGATALTMRLFFEDPTNGPPMNEALTSFVVDLPAGGGWVHALFPIAPADLIAFYGDVHAVLSDTTQLRLYDSPDPSYPGPSVVGSVGVDNIRAVRAVPEPAAWAMLLAGVGVLGSRRRNPR
jgi:hypothetical protein